VNNPVEKPSGVRPMKLILREFWLFAHGLGGGSAGPVF
jgi:hypothetical protein